MSLGGHHGLYVSLISTLTPYLVCNYAAQMLKEVLSVSFITIVENKVLKYHVKPLWSYELS